MLVQNVLASSVSERHFKATKRSCLKYICRVQHTLRNRVPCDSLSKLDSFHLNAPCSSSFPTSCSIVPFSFASYMLSRLSCVRLFVTPWTGACQAPLSMGFSRQEYWSALPFPSPGDFPSSGTKPTSLMPPALAGGSLPLGSPASCVTVGKSLHPCAPQLSHLLTTVSTSQGCSEDGMSQYT